MGDIFYIVGIGLTALALILSFAGMKLETFPPSRAAMAGVLGFMGALVVATCAFAIVLSREEAEHREEKRAEEAEAAAGEGEALTEAEEPTGEEVTESDIDGAAVFTDTGCAGCHTLAAAGSDAAVGPNLDESLAGKDESFIETSIVDPGAALAAGFGGGIMPTGYATQLDEAELAALVAYLAEST